MTRQRGKITFDGIDLRDFRILDLRKEISVVFQDYTHYNLTARENIWFGDVNMPADGENVLRAAECSGANCIIDRLDNGYETILGKWLEDGTELSTGEWQKIALARAFFRDSQVIVLDEPTSSLVHRFLINSILDCNSTRHFIPFFHFISPRKKN
jgi:ATP-binding cassette subfamily B protein